MKRRVKACVARRFDLQQKPDSTVPMYADESGFFVFVASLTSGSPCEILLAFR